MNITTKYSLNQHLFRVSFLYSKKFSQKVCPNCHGKYEERKKGGVWRCSSCDSGKVDYNYPELNICDVEEVVVYRVTASVHAESNTTTEDVYLHNVEKGKINKNTYSHFIVGEDDVLGDAWIDLRKDCFTKAGIPVKHIHLSLEEAQLEYNRVKQILKDTKVNKLAV